MQNKKKLFLGFFFSLVIFIGVFFSIVVSRSATSSSLDINFIVPSVSAGCGNGVVETGEECDGSDFDGKSCSDYDYGCGSLSCDSFCNMVTSACSNECGGSGDSTNPVIENVVETPSIITASVNWQASDNVKLKSCIFNYGINTTYNSSTMVSNSEENFLVDLSSLDLLTEYFYKITCLDSFDNKAEYEDSFTTLEYIPEKFLSLEVYARSEKRVGQNNFDLDALLLFVNPNNNEIIKMIQIDLDNTGYFINENIELPIYNDMGVFIKGRSHLAKKIVDITIGEATENIILNFTDSSELESWGSYYLSAGDVQGNWPGLKDNFIDVLDISAVDVKFNQLDDLDADLNKDGVVDVLDVAIILTNFNNQGDLLP